jgi:hypothetical protein
VPRKLVTPALTTKESPDIFAEALKDQQISPFQKPWEDSADNEAQRKNVVDLIGAGLLLLEGDNLLPSLEKYQLKVGECVISYKGLDIFDQNKSNTYYANLFLRGSNDSELIQKLIDLGWSDIRPGSFTQNLPSILIKEWEKDTDSVDIVNFLIDTNELFSIKPSEIEIARQKENE